MEVSSLYSAINTASSASAQAQTRVRQPEQDQPTQQAQQSRQSEQAQGTQQAQKSPPVNEREAAGAVRDEAERNRPTVNANGQTVGTRVNTTA